MTRNIFWGFAVTSLAGLLLALIIGYIFLPVFLPSIFTGYMLSFIFLSCNFIVINKVKAQSNKHFFKVFVITLGIRFLAIIIIFVLVIRFTNFNEFYFTVSFIISYILHSLTEIITINKILATDNS